MVFWIAILAGVLFVWLAVRMGFYETWALFFNAVVSIYVSIFLAPLLMEFVPTTDGGSAYHAALCLLVLAGGCFALLQGLSYVFLTSQFHIQFPRVFDIVLSGVLGFGTGFLLLSFLALVLTTTPLAKSRIVGIFGLGKPFAQTRESPARDITWKNPNLTCLTRCCDVIHAFAGFHDPGNTTRAAVQRLLEVPQAAPRPAKKPADANAPPQEENSQHQIPNPKQTQIPNPQF